MGKQPGQQPLAAATQELRDLSSTRGPSIAQVLGVVMLALLGGVFLLLVGLTLTGTLIGLAVTAPLFVLFSPVLIPAALTIGLAVAGFLTSVAFGVTGLFFFTWMVNYLRRTRERHPISDGQHEDDGPPNSSTSPKRSDSESSASVNNVKEKSVILVNKQQKTVPGGQREEAGDSDSMTTPERSDSGPSASVDVMKEEFNIVSNQQQQNNGKRALRKADDPDASSTSATSMESNIYDVFLSFRGQDTRKQFTDHLYQGLFNSGISVFRDNDELPVGENFSPNLFHAIKSSKISIPVLSQNYASSSWCLQELAQMVERMKRGRHIILPIFYEVEPSNVRYQKGSFGEIFSRLSEKYEKEDVDKWKQALREVANLNGWDSKTAADGYEGELVEQVVRKVWSELKNAFQLVVTEQLVGIDNAVEEVLRLLDDDSNATKIVGIHGMGGIGKTTLAKVVYNKLINQFKHCSFIADIRESGIDVNQS